MTRRRQGGATPRDVGLRAIALSVALILLALFPPGAGAAPSGGTPTCEGAKATIVGTGQSDKLKGTPGRDVIVGRGGADVINGKGGNDAICGKSGFDELDGKAGDDTIRGGKGADGLRGGGGTDTCSGGPGVDEVGGCERGAGGERSPGDPTPGDPPPGGGDPPGGGPGPGPGPNPAPTNLALSNSSVAENEPAATTVGTLSASDPGDTHTFALVSGAGDADNASFQITGSTLKTNAVFNFETKSSYSIRVRATDSANNTFDKQLTITITDVAENVPPTDISLSPSSVAENEPVATAVGTLSATDPGDTHTFALVSGAGDADNASFQITGSTLKTNAVFNFEADSSYSIRVRATDTANQTFEKQFTITITNVNEAPTATNDSYSGAIGNTKASRGVSVSGEPVVALSGNVLTQNDTDPDAGASLTALAETVASTGGGTATINSNGSFTYVPGVGDKNQNDTFSYKVTDGSLESTGTVTIAIANEIVWYADRDAASNGDGRSSSALQNLAGINGVGGAGDADTTGERVFLYSSATSYTGGLPLEASQRLIGEPEGLVVSGNTLVPAAGSNPTITNSGGVGIGLANSVLVRHVNVSGTSGAGVSGSGATGIDYGFSTISNPSGAGFSLTNTDNVAIQQTAISGADHAGVSGTGVSGFSFTDGSITNAGDAQNDASDAAFAFNSNPSAATNNVDGNVIITGNTITNPYGGGVEIFNRAGTISDAQIANNSIVTATTQSDSKGDGIAINARGTTTSVASVTKATIQNNNIQNIPSGFGILVSGGNASGDGVGETAPPGSYGTPGSATDVITITGNSIKGDATTKINNLAISAATEGRGSGNFAITNNGTAANPLANMTGAGIGAAMAGDGDATFVITGNFLAPNNEFNSPGIALSSDKTTQEDLSVLSDPDVNATVTGNTTSNHEGAGIRVLQANSNGSMNLKLQNNTFGAPIQSFSGIRVENGSSADASWNPTMCANISGNTSATGPADAFGDQAPGIILTKRSTLSNTYVFGLVGLSPSPATAAQTETYVAGQNPGSAVGAGFYVGKKAAVVAGDNFTSCTLPF